MYACSHLRTLSSTHSLSSQKLTQANVHLVSMYYKVYMQENISFVYTQAGRTNLDDEADGRYALPYVPPQLEKPLSFLLSFVFRGDTLVHYTKCPFHRSVGQIQ